MKITKVAAVSALLLIGVAVWAQEYPLKEVGFDFSYARYAPRWAYTQGHRLSGGGGSPVYNIADYLGINVELQGYGSNLTHVVIPAGLTNFPRGFTGSVQGNLFTYMFGPQLEVRVPKFQAFVHFLLGEPIPMCMAALSVPFANRWQEYVHSRRLLQEMPLP